MIETLLHEFMSSSHGSNAVSALTSQGFTEEEGRNFLQEAIPSAQAHLAGKVADHPEPTVGLFNLFGGHTAKSFLIGLTEGIVRGEGFKGALEDGLISGLAGHLGDVVGPKLGIDSEKASLGAAVVAPFIVHYAHDKLSK